MILEASEADLDEVAACHILAFPNSLSSRMGLAYVRRMYGWYLNSPNVFLYVAKESGHVVGISGGMLITSESKMGSASSMIQYSFSSAVKGLLLRPYLLFHPELISKYRLIIKNVFLKLFGHRKTRTTPGLGAPHVDHAGLVILAVRPDHQGGTQGGFLLNELLNHGRKAGVSLFRLSVKPDNTKLISAYKRTGWIVTKQTAKTVEFEKKL